MEHPEKTTISPETNALLAKLLLEKIPWAGLERVTGVSARWWQNYVNKKYAEIPPQVEVQHKKKTE